jgi:hypothetical protein
MFDRSDTLSTSARPIVWQTGKRFRQLCIPELGFSSRDFGSKYHNLYSTVFCTIYPRASGDLRAAPRPPAVKGAELARHTRLCRLHQFACYFSIFSCYFKIYWHLGLLSSPQKLWDKWCKILHLISLLKLNFFCTIFLIFSAIVQDKRPFFVTFDYIVAVIQALQLLQNLLTSLMLQ